MLLLISYNPPIRMNDTPQGDGNLGAFNSTCAFNNFSYKNE